MKNTLNVLSVRVFGIIALVAVIGFTMIACNKSGGSSGGGGGKTLNSPEALKEYLDSQPANSPDKPIKVSMGANELMLPKIRDVLISAGKYVSLNLTGNALTTIPNEAFYDDDTGKRCETLVSVTIPNSVTSIRGYAFNGCTSLASITIPNSVTSIGFFAFNYCISLTSITIPDSVTSIDDCAFQQSGLTSITIPNSVTSIDRQAFFYCASLTSVTFQGTITSANFDEYAFHGDLRDKYLAGGIGTYTTTTPVPANVGNWKPVWTKK